ncbi:hypothetical protein ABIA16_005595 [Sinorhizobium fredii]
MTLQQPALTATAALARPAQRKDKGRRDRGRLFQEIGMLAPAVVLLAIFLIVPFLLSFWTAMTNQPLVPRPTPVRFIGLTNFLRILKDDLFWTSLWNVSRFTFWILPVQCGLAFATALLLHQKLPFRNFFRGLFFLPAITSMVVVCVIWGTLFQYPTGRAQPGDRVPLRWPYPADRLARRPQLGDVLDRAALGLAGLRLPDDRLSCRPAGHTGRAL